MEKNSGGLERVGGTTDRVFMLRQLVEKRVEAQGEIGICGPVEGRRHCPKRDGDCDTEMDGNARSRSEVVSRDVQGNKEKSFGWSEDV